MLPEISADLRRTYERRGRGEDLLLQAGSKNAGAHIRTQNLLLQEPVEAPFRRSLRAPVPRIPPARPTAGDGPERPEVAALRRQIPAVLERDNQFAVLVPVGMRDRDRFPDPVHGDKDPGELVTAVPAVGQFFGDGHDRMSPGAGTRASIPRPLPKATATR